MKTGDTHLNRRDLLQRAATVAVYAGITRAGEPTASTAARTSCYRNGELHVNELGKPEGTPLTTGHMDFKPSRPKTDNRLVFFRRLKDDPVTVNRISAIGIINVDGTGLHMLSDGTHTDFNPTWTRDGLNTPIWNRKNHSAPSTIP